MTAPGSNVRGKEGKMHNNNIKEFYYIWGCQRVSKRASHELILIGVLSDRVPALLQLFINLKISEPNKTTVTKFCLKIVKLKHSW